MKQSVATRIEKMISTRNQKMLVLSTALVAMLSFAGGLEDESLGFCSCPANSQFDKSLPMSHTINRCASQQSAGVSWISWFSGSSASKQFHYLDLLELLTRVTEGDPESGSAS